MKSILSIQEFVSELARYWDLDQDVLDVSRPLNEVGIDSLAILELIVALEEFAGDEVSEDLFGGNATLRDVYQCYESYAKRDALEH